MLDSSLAKEEVRSCVTAEWKMDEIKKSEKNREKEKRVVHEWIEKKVKERERKKKVDAMANLPRRMSVPGMVLYRNRLKIRVRDE